MTEKLAYSVPEAVAASGQSRTSVYAAMKDGSLVARKRGRRTFILVEDLKRWLENLPSYEFRREPLSDGKSIQNSRTRLAPDRKERGANRLLSNPGFGHAACGPSIASRQTIRKRASPNRAARFLLPHVQAELLRRFLAGLRCRQSAQRDTGWCRDARILAGRCGAAIQFVRCGTTNDGR